ncbi:MAG: cupin domain-containing protein [Candidatus Kerfeldbacteria bacterium]|nr:cupin domain-containing protein [Candidatus Kerfeldbacteria bacterium]
MKGFHSNIEQQTLANKKFRQVLYTGKHSQLVLMCLQPQEEIGMEVHMDNDQFFRFESGDGKVLIDTHEYLVTDGSAIIVPAGAQHNVMNVSSDKPLQMYTLYAPAHHRDGVAHDTKKAAVADDEEFDGITSE